MFILKVFFLCAVRFLSLLLLFNATVDVGGLFGCRSVYSVGRLVVCLFVRLTNHVLFPVHSLALLPGKFINHKSLDAHTLAHSHNTPNKKRASSE